MQEDCLKVGFASPVTSEAIIERPNETSAGGRPVLSFNSHWGKWIPRVYARVAVSRESSWRLRLWSHLDILETIKEDWLYSGLELQPWHPLGPRSETFAGGGEQAEGLLSPPMSSGFWGGEFFVMGSLLGSCIEGVLFDAYVYTATSTLCERPPQKAAKGLVALLLGPGNEALRHRKEARQQHFRASGAAARSPSRAGRGEGTEDLLALKSLVVPWRVLTRPFGSCRSVHCLSLSRRTRRIKIEFMEANGDSLSQKLFWSQRRETSDSSCTCRSQNVSSWSASL